MATKKKPVPTRFTIPVVIRTQDNGDGGYTTSAYNSTEELLAAHFAMKDTTGEIRSKMARAILEENDPYENGYIGYDSIEVEIVDGKARLAEPLSFHAGQ